MPYWQLYYHVVWSTRRREPLLTPDVEPIVYGFLRGKAIGLGATVFALNGTEDHVHLVAAIPPRIAVAKFIGQIKGVASTRYNKTTGVHTPFYWQTEYGVFSFDGKRLPNYIKYVERQKEHHRGGTTIAILERMEGNGPQVLRERPTAFQASDESWRSDLEVW